MAQNANEDRGRGFTAAAEDIGSLISGKDPDRVGEHASLQLMRKNLEATRIKIKFLGVDDGSGKNPTGVKMSFDEFVTVQRLKDPSVLIHNGQSLTDPIDENEIVGVLSSVVSGFDGMNDADKRAWENRYRLLSLMMQDPQMSGDTLSAMAENDPEMDAAIKYWKSKGVIDKMNNQNAGQVSKLGNKLATKVVESRIMSPLTPEEEQKFKDQYEAETTGPKVDPKNMKIEHIGKGITRTTVLNPDSSVAAQIMDGDVTLPTGQKIPISVTGGTSKDMRDVQDLADQTTGLFADAASGKLPKAKTTPVDEGAIAEDDVEPTPPEGYDGPALEQGPGSENDPVNGPNKPKFGAFSDEDGNGLDDASEQSAAKYGSYSAEDLKTMGNGLDSTGDPLEEAFDEEGNPVLFNVGDPEKEHYQNERGDAIMTGGKGLPGGMGGSNAPSSGIGNPENPQSTIDGILPFVPKAVQAKVANFFADALKADPTLTSEELMSMLPDEIQYAISDRMNAEFGTNDPKITPYKGPKSRPKTIPKYEEPEAKKKPSSKKKPSGGSGDIEELLSMLEEHPELSGQILAAIKKAQAS